VIEVSDTSLRFDRTTKLRLYARVGIPEYWIVDTNGRQVEVCRNPAGEGYEERAVVPGRVTRGACQGSNRVHAKQ
jgi:Uma2 family endonuclease